MTIAITGANGQLGRLVVERLKARRPDIELIALVRSPEKATDLGITVRQADYDRPDTLPSALTGINTLLLISSSEIGRRSMQHRNVIKAAKQAGVKHIIYTSVLHADTSALGLAAEHIDTESALMASGIPFTLLRNGWYTENYTAAAKGAVDAGSLMGSAGDGRIASASRSDYADAAVAVLTGDGHANKTYELAGDESYTLPELAAELSRQTGKPIPYADLPPVEYAAILASFGVPEPLAQMLAQTDVAASVGALYDDSRQLSRLIGRPTTPLTSSIATALAQK
ncbi:SDR family oxidoreductase [Pseudomonas fluorescens]|nr:SDR family oxidoreductase [Pseudomonas fluorescens]